MLTNILFKYLITKEHSLEIKLKLLLRFFWYIKIYHLYL
nr:MAG TPA_asm: hypothetical protein [Caudoviricetes sp.]